MLDSKFEVISVQCRAIISQE